MKRMRAGGEILLWGLMGLLLLSLGGCSRYTGNYNKGIQAFSNGDFGEAADIFSRCDPDYGNAAVYAAYSQGMVFWEQEQYSAASPYFEKCTGFMYGTQRYGYCRGVELMEAGDFAGAQQCFEALGSFENAAEMAQYCRGYTAEINGDYETALTAYQEAGELPLAQDRLLNLQTQVYSHALELKSQGDYTNALTLFSLLGDYLNSAAYARECRNVDLENTYNQADALESQGSLREAWEKFSSLGVYRDAADRANELAQQLGIPVVDESRPYLDLE